MQQKKPLPGIVVVLLDLLGIGAALAIFILFHHVLPLDSGEPIQNIVFGEDTPSVVETTPTPVPAATESAADSETAGDPSMSPTAVPTPTPAPGDFSASFPTDEPPEEDVFGSYVSDNLRIVVTEEHTDDAVYFVADVWIRNIREFKTAFADGTYGRGRYELPSDMASDVNAVLALSGDCYGARPSGIVIRNGDLYRESISGDVCVLYSDGVMETYYADEFDLSQAVDRGAYQAWSFGPKLIDNGEVPASYNTTSAIIAHNPRAAIGYYEPGHYCLLVVDGRQPGYSDGMTLQELSETFLSLGCTDAYNLDGGQSAMMIFNGQIVGQPYKGGRTISDILYFGGSDTE